MNNVKTKHGGKRPGSGRKKGGGKGRLSISRSVSMTEEKWQRLDALRGRDSRGRFIASLI